jgi:phosphate transport system substrate-binding protein
MKKIFLMIILLGCFSIALAATTITIKGSDTLLRLGQRWSEVYMKAHPDVVLQISGGGSGTGIAALLNGTTDICEASRDMKQQEYDDGKAKGLSIFRVAVALDGIAVFLNEANPVKELSLAQLKGIYTGSITNWKDVGGPEHVIILYGRENSSGTYAYFKEFVLGNADYAEQTQTLPGTAAVVNAVAKDKFGIGYGGIAYGKGVKYAAVKKADTTAAVVPSMETVTNGSYPISRELYWFFNGTPTGEMKNLLNWALSPDGQKIAEETDYVPLPKDGAAKNLIK